MTETVAREATWLTIVRLLRWDKPAGRLILMIPALWAVVLSSLGKPPLPLVGVIILGTLATSGAGCVINDLWDREIDPQVERTKNRPLAAKTLTVRVAIAIFIVALMCAGILALYLNRLSFWLAVGAVPIIVAYPLAKRVFVIPQLVLSLAWGFAVLISWSAVSGELSRQTWLLWGATVFWTLGFDTVYALADREDDQRLGINSSAIFFGKYTVIAIAIFFLLTGGLLAYLGIEMGLGYPYWLGWGLSMVAWVRQVGRLRTPEIPRAVYGEIFGQNVGVGFLLLAGMLGSLLI